MAIAGGHGLLIAGDMTRAYLSRILFRYEVPPETTLLLGTSANLLLDNARLEAFDD